jgi:type II secretion system protein I
MQKLDFDVNNRKSPKRIIYFFRRRVKMVGLSYREAPAFGRAGFTLLEVLVATAILGIAVAVILQLFSANLRALSVSDDFVHASIKAAAKMREILDNDKPSETSFSETTDDGYRTDVWIKNTLKERTENIDMTLFQIDVTVHWTKGTKERSLTVRTLKAVKKQI